MAWCFEDESNEYTDRILENLKDSTALVPAIWVYEVANVLLIARRKKRITESESSRFMDALLQLPIVVDSILNLQAMHTLSLLAAEQGLTIYDASYLELAIKEKIPLFTLDQKLVQAAKNMRIIFNPI
jgi:predicted nucleic acid-binding protein